MFKRKIIGISVCTAMLSAHALAASIPVNGTTVDINSDHSSDVYNATNAATVNVDNNGSTGAISSNASAVNIFDGGTVNGRISASNGSSIQIGGGAVINNAGAFALSLNKSTASIGDLNKQATVNGSIALFTDASLFIVNTRVNGEIATTGSTNLSIGKGTVITTDSKDSVVTENTGSVLIDNAVINNTGNSKSAIQLSTNTHVAGNATSDITIRNTEINSENGYGIDLISRFGGNTQLTLTSTKIDTLNSDGVRAQGGGTLLNADNINIKSGLNGLDVESGATANINNSMIFGGAVRNNHIERNQQ
ncbi:hypothetical protein JW319_10900 [Enterobacter cloacae subsp. cloacae]|uniref:hypothetical protein n=1 Tax=Enterobacter cloacae TaxID=550 RepID=UPI001C5BABD8|nr:hypothetical protein [Enterobacter cloacae]MBW4201880.1 hypothetical protein [Enterobacter cloacae subsp. cloacae]